MGYYWNRKRPRWATRSSCSADFGDNSASSGQQVLHTYSANGTYVVKLNVTDLGGTSKIISKSVRVLKSPDVTRDGNVTILDMAEVAYRFNTDKTRGDSLYNDAVDFNDDGKSTFWMSPLLHSTSIPKAGKVF